MVKMDYPISFNNNRVYSVPDTRFTKYGFALQRPAAVLQPSSPITSVNMLPYQGKPGITELLIAIFSLKY